MLMHQRFIEVLKVLSLSEDTDLLMFDKRYTLSSEGEICYIDVEGEEEVLDPNLNVYLNEFMDNCNSFYKEIRHLDIFDLLNKIRFDSEIILCVTTNGEVGKDGSAIMGAGIAKTIRDMCPGINKKLGEYIKTYGNRVFNLGSFSFPNGNNIRILSFPTKHKWREESDITLISKSFEQLNEMIEKHKYETVFLPYPGIGNGNLSINVVKNIVDLLCNEKYYVFNKS